MIEITKGNQTIAQLVPAAKKGFPIDQLNVFFQELPHLGVKGNARMADDLKTIHNDALLPGSAWEQSLSRLTLLCIM